MDPQKIYFGIVEDEVIERETMKLFIQNCFPEADVLWLAANGEEALAKYKEAVPDILIVDIQMPVMDGLTLCKALYEMNSRSIIVVHTAYDSFSYARKAILYQGFDYLVKPASDEELKESLKRAMQEAFKRRASLQKDDALTRLSLGLGQLTVSKLLDRPRDVIESSDYLEALGWPADQYYHTAVIHLLAATDIDRTQLQTDLLDLFPEETWLNACGFISNRHVTLLLEPRLNIPAQQYHTLLWIFGKYYTQAYNFQVHISSVCTDKAGIALECGRKPASPAGASLRIPDRTWRILRRRDTEKMVHTLKRHFSDGQFSRARRFIQEIADTHPEEAVHWEILQWCFDAYRQVWPEQSFPDCLVSLYRTDSFPAPLWEDLLQHCEKLPLADCGDIIDRAQKIMHEEFSQNLTQYDLALRLGVEQSYFSKLFKKKCGRNFSEYLTEIRMKHAEQLLKSNPAISLENLCIECGLSSKTYFSEAFKRWKGMTITQYLKTLEP